MSRALRAARHLRARGLRVREAGARRVELAHQARVLVRHPRVVGSQPVDHADQRLDFFFQAIDRLEIDSASCNCFGQRTYLFQSGLRKLCQRRVPDVTAARPVRGAQRVEDPSGRRPGLPRRSASDPARGRSGAATDYAAFRHALSLIPIELDDRDERCRRRRTDSATNRCSRQGFVDENRDVSDDRRKTRQRLARSDRRSAPSAQSVEVDFGGVDLVRIGKPAAVGDRGASWPTTPTEHGAVAVEPHLRGRPGTRNPGSIGAKSALDAERRSDLLERALRVEEVDRLVGCDQCGPVAGAGPDERRPPGLRPPRQTGCRFRRDGRPCARAAGCARPNRAVPGSAMAAGPQTSPTADWRSRTVPYPERRTAGPPDAR